MGNQLAVVRNKDTLKALFAKSEVQESIQAVIPRHLTPGKLLKTALIACSKNPKLLECTQKSLLAAIITGAELGLDVSGTLGRAYLIPYKNKSGVREATFIIGYLGLMDIVRRSEKVIDIYAHVIYKEDDFSIVFGLEQDIKHIPNWQSERKDSNIMGFYAVAVMKETDDSGKHLTHQTVMTKSEVDKIRNSSPGRNSSPWVNHYPEMGKKTVLRRLCKYLPASIEMIDAVATDDTQYEIEVDAGTGEVSSADPPDSGTRERPAAKVEPSPKKEEKKAKPEPEVEDAKYEEAEETPAPVPEPEKETPVETFNPASESEDVQSEPPLERESNADNSPSTPDQHKELRGLTKELGLTTTIRNDIMDEHFGFKQPSKLTSDQIKKMFALLKIRASGDKPEKKKEDDVTWYSPDDLAECYNDDLISGIFVIAKIEEMQREFMSKLKFTDPMMLNEESLNIMTAFNDRIRELKENREDVPGQETLV